jgi:hypothetical protein
MDEVGGQLLYDGTFFQVQRFFQEIYICSVIFIDHDDMIFECEEQHQKRRRRKTWRKNIVDHDFFCEKKTDDEVQYDERKN